METLTELGYTNLDADEIVFPYLGIDVHVNSTAFTIGNLEVQWYGIIIVIGLLLAMFMAFRNMRRVGLDSDRAVDAIIGGIIGAMIGARAYYVILNWEDYRGDIKAILNTREGGLAVFGGLIGAVIVGGIICKLRKVKFLPMMDLCGVGFLIGQGIGRWGNFTNQEAFGRNTNFFLGMSGGTVQRWIVYHSADATTGGAVLDPDVPVHPCFLYESIWCLTGALLLWLTLKKWRKFDGQIILMYMVWYGFGRFWIEGLRTDSLTIGSLRVSQALAAVICVASLVLLFVNLSRVKRMGRDYKLYVDTAESKALLAEADKRAEEAAAKKRAKQNPDAPTESVVAEEAEEASEQTQDEAADADQDSESE